MTNEQLWDLLGKAIDERNAADEACKIARSQHDGAVYQLALSDLAYRTAMKELEDMRNKLALAIEARDLAMEELRQRADDNDTYRAPTRPERYWVSPGTGHYWAGPGRAPVCDEQNVCKQDAPKDDNCEQCSTEWRDYRPADCQSQQSFA